MKTKECSVVLVTNNGMNETSCAAFQGCVFKSGFLPPSELAEAKKLDESVECIDDGSTEPRSDDDAVYFG